MQRPVAETKALARIGTLLGGPPAFVSKRWAPPDDLHLETQRIRKLAELLLSEAAGETVELRLPSSFRPMSPMPDGPSASPQSAGLLGPADVDAMVHDYVEQMRAEQERRPLPARGRLTTLLASIPAVWLDAIWAALSRLPDALLLHERSLHQEAGWSVELGFDDDEIASWDDLDWGESERSFGLFFLRPEGEGFRFEIESEFLDEEGRLHPTSGVGHIGWPWRCPPWPPSPCSGSGAWTRRKACRRFRRSRRDSSTRPDGLSPRRPSTARC